MPCFMHFFFVFTFFNLVAFLYFILFYNSLKIRYLLVLQQKVAHTSFATAAACMPRLLLRAFLQYLSYFLINLNKYFLPVA